MEREVEYDHTSLLNNQVRLNFVEEEAERTEEHKAVDSLVLDKPVEGNLAADIPAVGKHLFHKTQAADNLLDQIK